MASLAATRTRPGPLRAIPRVFPSDPASADTGEALNDAEVMELASRLLNTRSEAERDHLLGATLTLAAERTGGALPAPVGRALGGLLKSVAAQALVGPQPGRALGLELEGLDRHEREFETMLRFVRLAGEAARHAAEEGLIAPPRSTARAALAAAADAYAPALLSALEPQPGRSRESVRRNGVIAAHAAPPGVIALRVEPFDYDPEMEFFLGGLVKSVGRAAGKAAKAIGKVPILGDVARAGIGAVRLGLGPAAIAIDAGSRLARGQSLGKALKGAVGGQIDAVRSQLRLAEMVAPFVPGIGTGVAAALGAANALAAGRPITEAVLAAARSALPGGAVAQAAFDTALNLAKGKNIGQAVLAAARDRLPGGPAARAAFDGAVALAQGKRLQDAAFAAAGRILPPSPYAADALAFVKRVANGQNVQHAALSVVGQRAVRQIRSRAVLPSRELAFALGSTPTDDPWLRELPLSRRKPGHWRGNLNGGSGREADRRYQRQITGRPTLELEGLQPKTSGGAGIGSSPQSFALRVRIVGYASPRWTSAKSAAAADRLNFDLSSKRAEAVRAAVEKELRAKLGNNIKIDYAVSQLDPHDPQGIEIGSYGAGSHDALVAARGDRRDNSEMGRKVEVMIEKITTTYTTSGVSLPPQRLPGKADTWALGVKKLRMLAAGASIGSVEIVLRNRLTNKTMYATADLYGGGLGGGVAKAGSSLKKQVANTVKNNLMQAVGDFIGRGEVFFTTKNKMGFNDFDGEFIRIGKATASLGLKSVYAYAVFPNISHHPKLLVFQKKVTVGLPDLEAWVALGKLRLRGPNPGDWWKYHRAARCIAPMTSTGGEFAAHLPDRQVGVCSPPRSRG